jgi:hypothetical protein
VGAGLLLHGVRVHLLRHLQAHIHTTHKLNQISFILTLNSLHAGLIRLLLIR